MMIARDDSAIFVKTAAPNGNGYTLDVFVKRPPAPAEPTFDPSAYVRKDELPELIAAAVAAQNAPKRVAKKEENAE